MRISFHTDAFNSAVFSFFKSVDWARNNKVRLIECGVMDGANWIHGLGYFPHITLAEDPLSMKRDMVERGVAFSQLDAAYPLSGRDGPHVGVPYVLKTFPWAKLAGCPNIATTDGLHKPEGMSDAEAMESMKRCYGLLTDMAELYGINLNIEIHGYFTTRPDMLERMLEFADSKYFGLNFDTGNTFIAGNDPVELCKRFIKRINHVHIKDVSKSLADAVRGKATGIGISHAAVGDGVNADNIKGCMAVLRDAGYAGALSLECEGQGGPLIEKSLAWLRGAMKELGIPEE
ncbi:MAG: sugar phosphate isomerase/epimerase [Planctomycetota bacterium]|jgi:sugar phosphate isomerase/epimerase|nr:sugar phosphate isomerase/epimerase [Planctomycetota bacterium]